MFPSVPCNVLSQISAGDALCDTNDLLLRVVEVVAITTIMNNDNREYGNVILNI